MRESVWGRQRSPSTPPRRQRPLLAGKNSTDKRALRGGRVGRNVQGENQEGASQDFLRRCRHEYRQKAFLV